MRRSIPTSLCVFVVVAGCNGSVLEVGGGKAPSSLDDGGAVTTGPVSCDGGSYASTPSDGSGYSAGTPLACSATDGPMQTLSSVAQVAQAVVGTWFDCGGTASGGTSIIAALGGDISVVAGIQLTSDGHYVVAHLDTGLDPVSGRATPSTPSMGTLVPYAGTNKDGGPGPAVIGGTYQVVDASATLGPGAYQIQLQPSTGGTYVAQVVMLGSPTKMRFVFSTGPSSEDFAPALPMTFRTGVCSFSQFGPQVTPTSAAETAAAIKGTWLWCAGPAFDSPNGPVVGIEFPGDGTWFNLIESDTGAVARGSGDENSGIVDVSDGTVTLAYTSPAGTATPVSLVFSACGPDFAPTWTMSNPADEQTIFQRSPTNL